MSIEHNRCAACGSNIDKREIAMFRELALALWMAFRWCKTQGRHEFHMKEVRDRMGRNAYARFGDWNLFGGLVYKNGKGNYGLNMERCEAFFKGDLQIPMRIWKDPITKELEKVDYGTFQNIHGLGTLLDSDQMYVANYKPGTLA